MERVQRISPILRCRGGAEVVNLPGWSQSTSYFPLVKVTSQVRLLPFPGSLVVGELRVSVVALGPAGALSNGNL
jgi:hypothetical protein